MVSSDTDSDSLPSGSQQPIESLYEQDFHQLRAECLADGRLFEDPEFLARDEFLRDRSKANAHDIVWLRPHQLARPDAPILVSNRNEGFDVKPGLDAWFVAAFSAIADSDALLRHVVPPDQGFAVEQDSYAGIFHFRFWFGRWIEIVIDDLLPTRHGSLIYMRSNSSLEFWPSLLEKAYAKAKGTYELLNNWLPIDACIELTGGCPERVRNMPALLHGDQRQVERLFHDILRANQNGNIPLVSCNHAKKMEDSQSRQQQTRKLGLEPRYVYRITQVADLGHGRRIVRIKNCSGWTDPQWSGAWSPSDDANWASVADGTRRELDGEAFHDGGFWIGFHDFLTHFDTIDFCHINRETDREVVFNGRWEIGLNAGGVQKGDFKNYAKNPQCFIELRSPNAEDPENLCSAVISLMQRRQQASKVKGVNKIGFRVYRVDKDAEELTSQFFSYRRNDGRHKAVAKTPTWQDGRESNIRVRLPPGKYCIIPSTFLTDQQGDFILRVHIEMFGPEVEQHQLDSGSELETNVTTTALIERVATPPSAYSERSSRTELKYDNNEDTDSRPITPSGPPTTSRHRRSTTPVVYNRSEGRATPIYAAGSTTSGRAARLTGPSASRRRMPLYGSRQQLNRHGKV